MDDANLFDEAYLIATTLDKALHDHVTTRRELRGADAQASLIILLACAAFVWAAVYACTDERTADRVLKAYTEAITWKDVSPIAEPEETQR